MSLVAWVHCNCIETGLWLTPPPSSAPIILDETGLPEVVSEDMEVQHAFFQWRYRLACPHRGNMRVNHRIGSVGHVTWLRETIYHLAGGVWEADALYPVLLRQVICNGTHSGDWIAPEQIPTLRQEMEYLREPPTHHLTGEDADSFATFQQQMDELIAAALQMKKPICF